MKTFECELDKIKLNDVIMAFGLTCKKILTT